MNRLCCGITLLTAFILAATPLAYAGRGQTAAASPWPAFQVIMWQTKLPAQYKALEALGVTAARVQADRSGETPESAGQNTLAIVAAGLRPYVENAATDFYSAYHRWFPDKPVNWQFLALQKTLALSPGDRSALVRQPSLADPGALGEIEKRLTQTARSYAPYRPLFTNLADEPGIADLTAAWDFDFSQPSLTGLRIWLKDQYGTLDALNHEWGSRFQQWQDVVPPTTTEAMARSDGNYASWSDFKDWMDLSFARAVSAGTQAVHAGAPGALAAIEGAQMPGWGGYDYSRLAQAVDVMEMYDAGGNIDIAQSFNPDLVLLTTSSWDQPDARHLAWRAFLRGARGMVLWDDDDAFVAKDGSVEGRGRTAASFFAQAHGPLGRLLMASRTRRDPVAVLYSPASFRVQWMLDHRALGAAWTQRGSQDENEDNAVRAAQRRCLERLAQLGLTPRFVSDAQIAQGILRKARYKALFLPQAIALSPGAAGAMRDFARAGGGLISDGAVGQFDGHGRHLARPMLADLFAPGSPRAARLPEDGPGAISTIARLLKLSGVAAVARIENASGEPVPDVRQYVLDDGPAMIVALLADPATQGAENPDAKIPVTLVLGRPAYAYDVASSAFLGRSQRLTMAVASDSPSMVALVQRPLRPADCNSLSLPASCSAAAP